MRGDEIRDKTVSPVVGVTSMFDGLISGFKEKISGTPSYIETNGVATGTASSASAGKDNFDLSGVVVLDSSATTTGIY